MKNNFDMNQITESVSRLRIALEDMGYRSADLSEMSIEQRKYYQKMKQVYKLLVSDRVKRHENELIQKLMMK